MAHLLKRHVDRTHCQQIECIIVCTYICQEVLNLGYSCIVELLLGHTLLLLLDYLKCVEGSYT
jgi:hypothetical protein